MAANSLHGATCRLQGKKSTPPDDPKQPQTSECRATQTERNLRQPWRPYIKQTIALQTLGNTNAGSSIHSRCIGTTHTRAKRMQNGAFFTTSSSQSSYSNDCREPRAQYLIYTQQKLQQGPVPANFCIALLRKETSQRQHPPFVEPSRASKCRRLAYQYKALTASASAAAAVAALAALAAASAGQHELCCGFRKIVRCFKGAGVSKLTDIWGLAA